MFGKRAASNRTCTVHRGRPSPAHRLSQRGDASYGLGGWWSVEVAGTRGTFCIENCLEKVTYWKAPDSRGPAASTRTPVPQLAWRADQGPRRRVLTVAQPEEICSG